MISITHIFIRDLHNISNLIISSYVAGAYIFYNVYKGCIDYSSLYYTILPTIKTHALIDLFIDNSFIIKLHNICILILCYTDYISKEQNFFFIYFLLNTEISTLFYVFKYWIPKKNNLYYWNAFLFYISFFKFRIYDFYAIYPNTNLFIKNDITKLTLCYLGLLNVYWFISINRIFYKNIKQDYKNHIKNHTYKDMFLKQELY
jgi:hypothetical protein